MSEELSDAKREADHLAFWLWEKHYMDDAPGWGLCDTVSGVILQIDNMVCGLIKEPSKADLDEYCKANGLVVIPEEPFNEALNILKKVRDGELGNCNAYRDLIAAFKEQAF